MSKQVIKINAGFNRRLPGPRKRYEWRNVMGMIFELGFTQLTAKIVSEHPSAPKTAKGWQVQGWCLTNAEDTKRRLKVQS